MALLPPDKKNGLLDQPLSTKSKSTTASTSPTRITTEQTIIADLEITPFDITTLTIFLEAEHWIPKTTNADDIDSAAFNFHRNFRNADFPTGQTSRLQRLFEAWNDVAEEKRVKRDFIERLGEEKWFEEFEALRKEREMKKYDAVRALVAEVAGRRERERDAAAVGTSS